MEEINVKLKRWGNSLGAIIPSEIIRNSNLREGIEVTITLQPKRGMSEVFGSLKEWKINTQKLKDKLREEWD
ncbi:DUF104 domain-containing protein [Candidatus Pacearchaeota archaeon]|nr:DUF104 domain-containing protein [Candidatus Pacearchaeota archaeon]